MKINKFFCIALLVISVLIIILSLNINSYAVTVPGIKITSYKYSDGEKMREDDVRSLEINKTVQLYAVIGYGNDLYDPDDPDSLGWYVLRANISGVVWKSNDEKIATISNNGLVFAKGEGKVTITAEYTGEDGKQIDYYYMSIIDSNKAPENPKIPNTDAPASEDPAVIEIPNATPEELVVQENPKIPNTDAPALEEPSVNEISNTTSEEPVVQEKPETPNTDAPALEEPTSNKNPTNSKPSTKPISTEKPNNNSDVQEETNEFGNTSGGNIVSIPLESDTPNNNVGQENTTITNSNSETSKENFANIALITTFIGSVLIILVFIIGFINYKKAKNIK